MPNAGAIVSIFRLCATILFALGCSAVSQAGTVGIGKVSLITGEALLIRSGTADAETVTAGTVVCIDDAIRTQTDSSVRIALNDNRIVQMGSDSSLKFDGSVWRHPTEQDRFAILEVVWNRLKSWADDHIGFMHDRLPSTWKDAAAGVRGVAVGGWRTEDAITLFERKIMLFFALIYLFVRRKTYFKTIETKRTARHS